MGRKLDPDIKAMSHGERGQELQRLRNLFMREANNTGNRRCWVNVRRGCPGGKVIKPLSLLRSEFLGNCAAYFDRNQK